MSNPNDDLKPKEVRKSILIIKSQTKSLTAVESFLRNRDWRIQSTTNMKDALNFLVTQKPSFVMVSMDHPNKKVRNLPKLLQQAFPVFVMVFAESNTTASYKNLVDSGCAYRINPPATGPAVERTINKIIRDQEAEKENKALGERVQAQQATDEAKQDAHASYAAKPSGGSDMISVQGAGPGSHNQNDSDLMRSLSSVSEDGGDDDADIASFLSTAAAEAKNNPAQFAADDATALGALLTADQLPAGEDAVMEEGSSRRKKKGGGGSWVPMEGGESEDGSVEGDAASFGAGAIVQKGHGPGDAMSANQEGTGAGELMSADQKGPGAGQAHSATQGTGPGAPLMAADVEASGLGPAMQSGQSARKNSNQAGHVGHDGAEAASTGGTLMPTSKSGTDHILPGFRNPNRAPQPRYDESDIDDKSASSADPVDAPSFENRRRHPHSAKENDFASNSGKPSAEADGRDPSKDTVRVKGSSQGWAKNDNIIVRGTQKALEDSINVGSGEVKQKVEDSSNVACLIVESAKFSGFLVTALGKNRKIDEKFINVIRDRLGKFLKDNGEPIKDEESMSLKIKKVDFEDWALEYADFLRKSVHDGEEIAMAFFPFAEAKTQVQDSASSDMGAVKLDELKGDIPVDFNLYVYLPSNKKYVLYTPRGSKFYGNQKDRLDKMGVTHMHVRRTELQDVSKYRAQNYLNSKIEEFQSRKKPARAS